MLIWKPLQARFVGADKEDSLCELQYYEQMALDIQMGKLKM